MSIDKLYNDKKGSIYYWYGASMILLKNLRAKMHRHYPVEVYIGLDEEFEINLGDGWSKCRAVAIDSNQPHQIVGDGSYIALFLFDPNFHNLNRFQNENFSDKKYFKPDAETIFSFVEKINRFMAHHRTCSDARALTDELVSSLFNIDSNNKEIDLRIKRLLSMLDDIPEKKISSQELAQLVGLSESRLAHLFKEETGTPIRRYLLWLRLREAMKIILNGESFTTAAHESGFSDSAHLSRTYKEMFGICPSDLLKSYQSIELISSFK